MKSPITQPSHITTDNIFEDLGFSAEEAAELKIKSDIFLAIRRAYLHNNPVRAGLAATAELCPYSSAYAPPRFDLSG